MRPPQQRSAELARGLPQAVGSFPSLVASLLDQIVGSFRQSAARQEKVLSASVLVNGESRDNEGVGAYRGRHRDHQFTAGLVAVSVRSGVNLVAFVRFEERTGFAVQVTVVVLLGRRHVDGIVDR